VSDGAVLIVGGTSGICLRLAETYAAQGREVVICGRDLERTAQIAATIEGAVTACAVDLSEPAEIAGCLSSVGSVSRLVVGAIERDENTVAAYDVARALRLVTL
jgi:3-oxoacyl-[acyl-carrier protein] reductase